MRIALTLDGDVAAALDRLRKQRDMTLNEVVNEVLRCGLKEMAAHWVSREPFKIKPFSTGPARVPIVSIEEALVFAEGEGHK